MFTISLIGADGAGKTTVCGEVLRTLPLPVKYIYMGVNMGSSNVMLPTTRLLWLLRKTLGKQSDTGGPRDPNAMSAPPKGFVRRTLARLKAAAWLLQTLTEEGYRYGIAWWYTRRGYVVVCDRHFFVDYYHYDIAPTTGRRPLFRRLHGYFLNNIFPQPDLIIFLDAPAEVLFGRKGEGTLEVLEHRRRQYGEFEAIVRHFHVIDASQSLDGVVSETNNIISGFCQRSSHRPTALTEESEADGFRSNRPTTSAARSVQ